MTRIMQEYSEHLVGAEGEHDGHAESFEAYLNTISQKPRYQTVGVAVGM